MNKLSSFIIKKAGFLKGVKNMFDPSVIGHMTSNAIKKPLIGLQARSGFAGKKAINSLRGDAKTVANKSYSKYLSDRADVLEKNLNLNKTDLNQLKGGISRLIDGKIKKEDLSAIKNLASRNLINAVPAAVELGMTGSVINDLANEYSTGAIGGAQAIGGLGSELLSLAAFGPLKNEIALSVGSGLIGEGAGAMLDEKRRASNIDKIKSMVMSRYGLSSDEYDYLKRAGYL